MLSEAQLKVLIHRIEAKIPDRIGEYYKDRNHRSHIATKYGADKAYLDSNNLSFIVIDPFNGKYRCDLCLLAIFKAMWNTHRQTKKPRSYYEQILQKAKDLYKQVGCQDVLNDKFNLPDNFDVKDIR